ncbi:dTDP-4-amino-4,6-dideoxygalactose transaminase [Saonia flava]|uniref:dTDP-4-amino-4,6-dideoxygalactose transaminase n=1 Tax=Saonia flava TaxID=523696 RepID=A0A846QUM3_9FLAO|nr:DegT/DnrJ/EryC1/StrS family aminotransferase [Saonia flava]NJB72646.1 dTDP-4-amino-4,6-dideoxygalactose transaminase [Saonia flava]
MIPITKPFLPPKKVYNALLNGIWKRNWVTNMGPLVSELETKLKENLGLENALFVTNGTIALQLAIKALELKGEIITTPYTYVATTSSIVWEGCSPVFVDIDKENLNIDPTKIEAAITKKTSAILATHLFGNPCDVVAIQKIADKYNLKVVYDGAHAFGVKVNGNSIFNYGDVSTCSFHATKLFHTVEGGLVVTKDPELIKSMAYSHNFGHDGPEKFKNLGINGKNSEFHAAMGLANINYVQTVHNQAKSLTSRYDKKLKTLKATKPKWHKDSKPNYSYYPIVFESEALLIKCIKTLMLNEIFGRRYFYPSLADSLPYVDYKKLEFTDDISKRVFCLPLYYDLTLEEVNLICRLLLRAQNSK